MDVAVDPTYDMTRFDVDGLDLIICVCLVGGFATGIWLPAIFFTAIGIAIAGRGEVDINSKTTQ